MSSPRDIKPNLTNSHGKQKSGNTPELNLRMQAALNSPTHPSAAQSPRNSPRGGASSPRLFRKRSDSLTQQRNSFNPGTDLLPLERKNKAEDALPVFLKEIKNNPSNQDFLSKYYTYPLTSEAESALSKDFVDFAENKMEDLLVVSRLLASSQAEATSASKEDSLSSSPKVLRRQSISAPQMPDIVNLFKDHVSDHVKKLQP